MSADGSRPAWPMSKVNLGKLENKKYRQRWQLYCLEGASSVQDALRAGAAFYGVLVDPEAQREDERKLVGELSEHHVSVQHVDRQVLAKVSGLTTPPPVLGILEEDSTIEPHLPPVAPLVLALDRVQDPGNAGTLLRAAAFYGVKEVWLGKGTVERYNPKVLRAAMSAHLKLSLAANVNLVEAIEEARAAGSLVYAADMEGEEHVDHPDPEQPPILILGNEPNGVDPALLAMADRRLAISRRGPIDSLNVAMAGTVLLDRLLARKTHELQ